MNFPLHCRNCGAENWVDLNGLQVWQLNTMVVVEGFTCGICGAKTPFFFYTRNMEETLARLNHIKGPSFAYHFRKALNKARNIRERYYGSSQHSNEISPR